MSTLFTIQLKTLILVAAPAGTAAAFKMKRTDLMGLWWDQNDQLPTIGEYLNIPSVYHYVSILSPPSLSKFSRNGFPDVWQIILLCTGFGTFQPDIGKNGKQYCFTKPSAIASTWENCLWPGRPECNLMKATHVGIARFFETWISNL